MSLPVSCPSRKMLISALTASSHLLADYLGHVMLLERDLDSEGKGLHGGQCHFPYLVVFAPLGCGGRGLAFSCPPPSMPCSLLALQVAAAHGSSLGWAAHSCDPVQAEGILWWPLRSEIVQEAAVIWSGGLEQTCLE